MSCGNYYCDNQGYCTCSADAATARLHGTFMAWAFIIFLCAIFCVVVAWGIAGYQILSARKEFDTQTGKQKFSGLPWLYLSPLTVGFSTALVFIGVGLFVTYSPLSNARNAVQAVNFIVCTITAGWFLAGLFVTYIIFALKNRSNLFGWIKHKEYLKVENRTAAMGLAAAALVLILSTGAAFGMTSYLYVAKKLDEKARYDKEQSIIDAAVKDFPYEGTYNNEKADFRLVITKDSEPKHLRMAFVTKKGEKEDSDVCLLTPYLDDGGISYSNSGCGYRINHVAFRKEDNNQVSLYLLPESDSVFKNGTYFYKAIE